MNFKKLYFVLIAVLFAFSACSSDDDDEDHKSAIVGTWTYSFEDVSASAASSHAPFTSALEASIPLEFAVKEGYTITFNEDKTYHMVEEDGTWEKGTYTFENDILTTTPTSSSKDSEDTEVESMKATISNNVLTFTIDKKSSYVKEDETPGEFFNYVYEDCAEQLQGVDVNDIKITKADLLLNLKKK